ncbi:hypothetical protein AVEN_248730-1 [Araneus ventricosus]|uniref:Glutathione peroxidase n=1 Tax=Araneus ventricosus TaxID=182803 RepID=A0A4Y2LIE5_ARAVE|nr:hypothetical protein AVEN_248730-1 [Araneus ventricosus]
MQFSLSKSNHIKRCRLRHSGNPSYHERTRATLLISEVKKPVSRSFTSTHGLHNHSKNGDRLFGVGYSGMHQVSAQPTHSFRCCYHRGLGLVFAAVTCGALLHPTQGTTLNSRSCIRPVQSDTTVYNFTLPDLLETRNVSLSEYKGKVLLLVNVATY